MLRVLSANENGLGLSIRHFASGFKAPEVLPSVAVIQHLLGVRNEAFTPAEAKRLAERLEIHYTPEHGSWLNVAEVEQSVLARQALSRRIPDRETMQRRTTARQEERNAEEATVDW